MDAVTEPKKPTAMEREKALETKVKFWQAVALCGAAQKITQSDVEKMILYKADEKVSQAQVDQYMTMAKTLK